MIRVVIYGAGVVGAATQLALAGYGGYQTLMIDPPRGLTGDLETYQPDFAFVCVPTPPCDKSGSGVQLGAVREVLNELNELRTDLIVSLKSTVPPGTSEQLASDYQSIRLVFNPEFLTESTAEYDARCPARNVAGFTRNDVAAARELIGILPWSDHTMNEVVTATDAELIKLFANGFFALKVAFVNLMHDLAVRVNDEHDVDLFRDIVAADPMVADSHLRVQHKGYRGFGGKCLPKDLRMLVKSMQRHGVDHRPLQAVLSYNDTLIRLQGGEPRPREQTLAASLPATGGLPKGRETS